MGRLLALAERGRVLPDGVRPDGGRPDGRLLAPALAGRARVPPGDPPAGQALRHHRVPLARRLRARGGQGVFARHRHLRQGAQRRGGAQDGHAHAVAPGEHVGGAQDAPRGHGPPHRDRLLQGAQAAHLQGEGRMRAGQHHLADRGPQVRRDDRHVRHRRQWRAHPARPQRRRQEHVARAPGQHAGGARPAQGARARAHHQRYGLAERQLGDHQLRAGGHLLADRGLQVRRDERHVRGGGQWRAHRAPRPRRHGAHAQGQHAGGARPAQGARVRAHRPRQGLAGRRLPRQEGVNVVAAL